METTARLLSCMRCHCQVLICRYCDRGQVYCSALCSLTARRHSMRQAGQRYQQTLPGRHKHARRQQRYRERQEQKVTHQSSQTVTLHDELPVRPDKGRVQPAKKPSSAICCHCCGKACSPFVRLNFLQRHPKEGRHALSVWPLAP